MKSLVIGLGEVGTAIHSLLSNVKENVYAYDIAIKGYELPIEADVLHICFRYSPMFVDQVRKYRDMLKARLIIIHSTVPIGTTKKIANAVHSPVMGQHSNMVNSISNNAKWIGGSSMLCDLALSEMRGLSVRYIVLDDSDKTEALKLISLSKYAASIMIADYYDKICEDLGMSYDAVLAWDNEYNEIVPEHLRRPIIQPPKGEIGGHCVVPGTKMLNDSYPHDLFKNIDQFDEKGRWPNVIWKPCNIYKTAVLGKNLSIGMFTEIGNHVIIGNSVRIGFNCFIPEGVLIEDKAWIGPRVTFANDKYPPSGKDKWKKTIVREGARLGANVSVLPGVEIGKNAIVGMGSVVTKNIPEGETWAGNPAKKITRKGE